MRTEALWLLFVGAALFAGAALVSLAFGASKLRRFVLALCFGFTLGLGIVPAHGEWVVAPVLAFLNKGGIVAAGGVVYGLVWSAVFLVAASVLPDRIWRLGPKT
jgi:zinc transporter ZupT